MSITKVGKKSPRSWLAIIAMISFITLVISGRNKTTVHAENIYYLFNNVAMGWHMKIFIKIDVEVEFLATLFEIGSENLVEW